MIRSSVYVGASVDGFIARTDHRLDFLDSAEPVDGDMGFADFMASVDVLVMGRTTFEVVLDLVSGDDGLDWPYDVPVVVMSTTGPAVPAELADRVETTAEAPRAILDDLSSRGFRHVYVDGGRTIQSFLRAGLIDEIIVTTIPVLIGDGIPLFGELADDVVLIHEDTTVYENGCVQTHYRTRQLGA